MTGRLIPLEPASAPRNLLSIAPSARVTADVPQAPQALRVNPPPQGLEGMVLGRDSAGNLLVRTGQGTLAIATRFNPPPGTRVAVMLSAAPAGLRARITGATTPAHNGLIPGPGSSSAPAQAFTLAALTRTWPAAEQAREVTAQAASGRAVPLPRPGPSLAGELAVVVRALATGDLRAWLGPALNALERTDSGLAAQVRSEFDQLVELAADPGSEWRLYAVPLAAETGARQLRLFVHEPPEGAPPDRPRRFIVETEFPYLGEMQLDGLAQTDRLDLILRLRTHPGEAVEADLTALAAEARGAAGLTGSFELSVGGGWTMMPLPGHPSGAGFSV